MLLIVEVIDCWNLPCSIPDLQLDDLTIERNGTNLEVNTNGWDVWLSVGVISESKQQTWFTNTTVSDEEEFKEIIVFGRHLIDWTNENQHSNHNQKYDWNKRPTIKQEKNSKNVVRYNERERITWWMWLLNMIGLRMMAYVQTRLTDGLIVRFKDIWIEDYSTKGAQIEWLIGNACMMDEMTWNDMIWWHVRQLERFGQYRSVEWM